MTLISKKTEHGLRAMLYLAGHQGDGYMSIRVMSNELDISFHFLTKVLQDLTQVGLLQSSRGAAGGVRLAKSAKLISLLDVVKATAEDDMFSSCVLGLSGCGEKCPCPLHARWAVERKRIEAMFKRTKLDKLAGPIANGTLRLTN